MHEKILIISPSWIGDCVMSQSLFQVLHDTRANLQIDVYANKNLKALLTKMPQVTNVIENPFLHKEIKLFKRYKEGVKLRKNNYNQVIVLPGSLKSALVPFFAKIPIRSGFLGEMRIKFLNDIRILDKVKLNKMVDRYVSLAFPQDALLPVNIPIPKLHIDKKIQNNILDKFKLDTIKKIVSFCPGADYGPAKRWPEKYFAQLAQYFYEIGFEVWIFGSDKDFEVGNNIAKQTKAKCVNLCGKTNLNDVIYLLGFSNLVISNDSGLMHISCALEVPVVAIYGSTSYFHTPPLSTKSKILSLNLDCSPCFQRTCPLSHHNCMNLLFPKMVFEESLKFVNL